MTGPAALKRIHLARNWDRWDSQGRDMVFLLQYAAVKTRAFISQWGSQFHTARVFEIQLLGLLQWSFTTHCKSTVVKVVIDILSLHICLHLNISAFFKLY